MPSVVHAIILVVFNLFKQIYAGVGSTVIFITVHRVVSWEMQKFKVINHRDLMVGKETSEDFWDVRLSM